MKIVICGGRKFDDFKLFKLELDEILEGKSGVVLISGGADGADNMAKNYARRYGYEFQEVLADWENVTVPGAIVKTKKDGTQYNKRAGIDRNLKLLAMADMIVAFWDGRSKGTGHMVQESKRRNIPLVVVDYE